MANVSGYIRDLIARQVQECGVVVWYDPDRAYEAVASHLEIPGTQVFRLEDSLLRLRAQVEPLLEFVGIDGQFTESPEKPPRLVVYVPCAREDLDFGLIELDTGGSIMEPGAPALPRNTRLEVVARHSLSKAMASDQVEAICAKVAKGQYRLEDLDRLAEQGPGPGVGGLILVYGTAEAGEVTLRFLTDPSRDDALKARGGMPELAALLVRDLGIRLDDSAKPQEARRDLERLALLTDFVASLRTDQVPPSLEFVELPSGPTERQAIHALMERWRNRADLRPAYLAAAARRLRAEVGIDPAGLRRGRRGERQRGQQRPGFPTRQGPPGGPGGVVRGPARLIQRFGNCRKAERRGRSIAGGIARGSSVGPGRGRERGRGGAGWSIWLFCPGRTGLLLPLPGAGDPSVRPQGE